MIIVPAVWVGAALVYKIEEEGYWGVTIYSGKESKQDENMLNLSARNYNMALFKEA